MNLPANIAAASGPPANNALLESISKALTSGPNTTETLMFLAGVLAFALLIILAARVFGREPSNVIEPQIDYLTLAVDVLGLSERDRRDLLKVARHADLQYPVVMLLSPANLAEAATPALTAEPDAEFRRRLERLCRRLFDAPLPAAG